MIGINDIIYTLMKILNYVVTNYLYSYYYHCPAQHISISQLTTSTRRISGSSSANTYSNNTTYAKCELDSHADTTVAGANCIILHYTGKACDVSPYCDDYTPISNVPIVTAATA